MFIDVLGSHSSCLEQACSRQSSQVGSLYSFERNEGVLCAVVGTGEVAGRIKVCVLCRDVIPGHARSRGAAAEPAPVGAGTAAPGGERTSVSMCCNI